MHQQDTAAPSLATRVAQLPRTVLQRPQTGRDVAKKRTFLGMLGQALFYTWVIFTFIGGVVFVNIPLFNLITRYFYLNVVTPINSWYIENGRDSFSVVMSLSIAAAIVGVYMLYVVVQKYDIDIKVRNFVGQAFQAVRNFFVGSSKVNA